MSVVARVLRLSRTAAPQLALAVGAGVGAALSGIGLMSASAFLISRAAQHPPVLHLTVVIVTVRAFGLGRAALRYVERLAGHDAAFRMLGAVRVRAYEGLERAAPAGLRRLRSGDLVSRFVSDMDAAMDVLTRVALPYLVAALAGVATAAFLGALLPPVGVVVAVGLLAVALGVPVVQRVAARRADARTAPLRGRLSAQLVELVHGAPDLLMYGGHERRLAALAQTDHELRRAAGRSSAGTGLGAGLVVLIGGACVWAALGLGASAVRADAVDGVVLAVLVLTPLALFEAVSSLPAAAAQLAGARTALRRAFSLVDSQPTVVTAPDPAPVPPPPYHLRLEGVTARWSASGPDAVTGLHLDLPPGRHIALVGPSGCGKSTVAALLVRFLDPVHGAVRLNGLDLRTMDPDAVRRVVGLVAEDAYVFDTTIEENLRVARADATGEQLRSALAAVRLLDFVDGLPAGLATPVGDRLSGGERRRLVLARALLTDCPVLILDEPTEHLDDDVAAAVMADLLAAAEGRTVLLITHQQHGLAAMDEVVRLAFA
jgi:thiol reductant ABC exporter CydC subunit